jgi:predicted amidohydrolase
VVFPQAALSGYNPDEATYLSDVDPNSIEDAIDSIAVSVQSKQSYCIFGSATRQNDRWFNSVIFLSLSGERSIYHKIQLLGSDLDHFTSGNEAFFRSVRDVNFGILACCELLFPNRWSDLKHLGAQVIFHINNAVKPADEIWKHLLLARGWKILFTYAASTTPIRRRRSRPM